MQGLAADYTQAPGVENGTIVKQRSGTALPPQDNSPNGKASHPSEKSGACLLGL